MIRKTKSRATAGRHGARPPGDRPPPKPGAPTRQHKAAARREDLLLAGAWKDSLSEVTRGFAHDLNNLLAGILGLTEVLILQTDSAAPWQESLTQIKATARKAAQLVEQLTALHRAQLGREDYHDLNALVTQGADFLRRAIPRRVEFAFALSEGSLPVRADAVQLQSALASLILKLVQFVPHQGRLTFQTSQGGRLSGFKTFAGTLPPLPAAWLVIEIDAPGIPANALSDLINSSERGRTSGEGGGWGLFPLRRCVELHGGAAGAAGDGGPRMRIGLALPLADLSEGEPTPSN